MPIVQEKRLLDIKTALGPNALALRTLAVQEEISRLFQIEVELSSENGEIKFDEVVGHEREEIRPARYEISTIIRHISRSLCIA